MEDEKWQSGDDARGIDQVVKDPPITPTGNDGPSFGNNGTSMC